MKCKYCNGKGKIRGYFYEKTGVNKWEKVWGDSPCDECNGTGEIQQTEQEYIQTYNTEQLAEFLFHVRYDGQTPWKGSSIWEWLKQPHTRSDKNAE